MQTKRTPVSCGCTMLYGLFGIDKDSLSAILEPKYKHFRERHQCPDDPARYDDKIYSGETVIFSDADSQGNAKRLVEIIKKYDLGRVVSLGCVNPNTRSRITTYLWHYNGNLIPKLKAVRKAAVTKVARGAL